MKNETKRTLLRGIVQKVMRLRAVSIYAIIKVLLRSNGITKWRLKLYIKFKWIFFTCFLCSVMEFNVFSFSLFFSSVTFTSTFKARHSRRSSSIEAKNVRYGRPNQTYFINFCLRREKKFVIACTHHTPTLAATVIVVVVDVVVSSTCQPNTGASELNFFHLAPSWKKCNWPKHADTSSFLF